MYRIGELAKACGVKADTLRFYEKNGLISPGIRNESGYRLYGEQDRRRLEFIIRAKSVIDAQRKTFPRILIHHRQKPDLCPA